ncbi:DNA-methyltransferase [Micromonospora zamorensis]|uniref:DNA-methyltransferase n=1 Tax=Micromonospora zamorensis TaxID=709883 RepID=UPI003D95E38C
MQPYYQTPLVTLYLGDCRDIIPTLPARSVDLLIADPPYGVNWQSGRRADRFDAMDGDDGLTDWPAIIGDATRRLLRNHRHAYVFGYTPDQIAKPCDLGATAELIWDKQHLGPGNLSVPWGPEHERITFGVYEWSARNREKGSGRLAARLRQGSVIQAARPNSGQVRHPDEKPVPLLLPIVESSSLRGEVVFDPTAGVCSVGVAALLAGRRFVGIESERRYADLGVERLRAAEQVALMAGGL